MDGSEILYHSSSLSSPVLSHPEAADFTRNELHVAYSDSLVERSKWLVWCAASLLLLVPGMVTVWRTSGGDGGGESGGGAGQEEGGGGGGGGARWRRGG